MNINSSGVLYVVATPIGNLQDMSLRAIEVLKNVSLIVAEDTRHSQPLLQHFAINTPMIALHEHNEREKTLKLINKLRGGESIAIISDAGTPLISDPGFYLVREAKEANIKVSPIPGSCAAIAALSVSGLATDKFIFEGFLPPKSSARKQRLEFLKEEPRTLIFYEAPHRIMDFLNDLLDILGAERQVVIARELTKLFETVSAKPLGELIEWINADANQLKGEMVVIVAGAQTTSTESQQKMREILKLLLPELPLKKAVALTAKLTDIKKNEVYDTALQLKKNENLS